MQRRDFTISALIAGLLPRFAVAAELPWQKFVIPAGKTATVTATRMLDQVSSLAFSYEDSASAGHWETIGNLVLSAEHQETKADFPAFAAPHGPRTIQIIGSFQAKGEQHPARRSTIDYTKENKVLTINFWGEDEVDTPNTIVHVTISG